MFAIALVVVFAGQSPTPLVVDADTVRAAFAEIHEGLSVDEVLIQDALRDRLHQSVKRRSHDEVSAESVFRQLLTLRKQGKLDVRATRRGAPLVAEALPVGEIAARMVQDRLAVSFDEILIREEYLRQFDEEARRVNPDVTAYQARRAVLQLRKTRRLQPELLLRIGQWDLRSEVWTLQELQASMDRLPTLPGVYLFRDRTGYLYIGEAENLRVRLQNHLRGSDRAALANYLSTTSAEAMGITVEMQSFPTDSPMAQLRVRRAYESELIRSREPKFNVRP